MFFMFRIEFVNSENVVRSIGGLLYLEVEKRVIERVEIIGW